MNLENIGTAGLVFSLSIVLTRYLSLPVSRVYLLDHPNERSLHARPTPRTGGLAILGSLVAGLAVQLFRIFLDGGRGIQYKGDSLWILAMLLLISMVSFWNDWVELSPILRFGIHAAAAAGVVLGAGLTIEALPVPLWGALSLGHLAAPLTILFLMWMTNLYNFMDGMDGFAGGMTVLGFGFLCYLAWMGGSYFIFTISLLTVGAAGGFLLYNIPPAKIFMGDVGSILLGFLAGALSAMGVHSGLFDLWVPVLIFSPFILDATVTLLRRLLRGEKVWHAHREHYYQRMVLLGWSHRKTVLAEYGLMTACGLSAVAYTHASDSVRLGLLLMWILIYSALAFGVRVAERRRI